MRPHDVVLFSHPGDGAVEAMVDRVAHLGFEVRAELIAAGGDQLSVQLTRGEADELELAAGDIVWARPGGRARTGRSAVRAAAFIQMQPASYMIRTQGYRSKRKTL